MNHSKTTFSPMQRVAAAAGALAAVLALSALTSAAFAADAPGAAAPGAAVGTDVPSVVVRFETHSLDTERGTQEVYRRIVAAARAVCPDGDSRDLKTSFDARECRKAAVARAVARIHHPRLVQIAAAHDKRI